MCWFLIFQTDPLPTIRLADFAEGIGKAVELATAPHRRPHRRIKPLLPPPTPWKLSRRPTAPKNAPVAYPFDDDISDMGG